jgi:hypothetical protein
VTGPRRGGAPRGGERKGEEEGERKEEGPPTADRRLVLASRLTLAGSALDVSLASSANARSWRSEHALSLMP